MNVSFTKFKSKTRLVKSAFYDETTDKITIDGGTQLYEGSFETLNIKWDDFGQILDSIGEKECVGLGVCVNGWNSGRIKAEKYLKDGDDSKGVIKRGGDNFKWGGGKYKLMYLDIDHIQGAEREMDLSDFLTNLLEKLPEFKKVVSGFWLKPSSSAYVCKTGDKQDSGLKGTHCYFLINSKHSDLEIKKYVEGVSWAMGYGYVEYANGLKADILNRHITDTAVFSPLRLIYEGDPKCSPDVYVKSNKKKAIFVESIGDGEFNWGAYDSQLAKQNKRITRLKARKGQQKLQDERHEADRVVSGRSEKAQNRLRENINNGKFPSGQTVYGKFGEVKAYELLLDPEKWHEVACNDPEEPEYDGWSDGKAKIFTDGGNLSARIHSFAHGRKVVVVEFDLESVKEILMNNTEQELEAMGYDWEEIVAKAASGDCINEVEIGKMKEIVKFKYSVGKEEATTQIAAAGSVIGNKELRKKLEEFNEVWCQSVIGTKVKYFKKMYDSMHDWYYFKAFDKENMKSMESSNIVKKFNGKKMVDVVVSEQWLKWGGRKMYEGYYFDPHHDTSVDGDLPNGCLNSYEGHCTERATVDGGGWACGKLKCEGKGCFQWSVDNGFGVCSENIKEKGHGNWTHYVNHIYEVVCGKSGDNKKEQREHARWVLDWIVEVVQRPISGHSWCYGKTKKPETSLVLRGGQGNGKGTVFAPLKVLGKYRHATKSMSSVTNKFNAFVIDNVFLFADEATWGGGHEAPGILKGLISEEDNTAERKGHDAEGVICHTRLGVSSNTEWVVPAEFDDRRFSVFDVTDAHHRDHKYYTKIGGSLGQFLDLCLDFKITSELKLNVQNSALVSQKSQMDVEPEEEFLLDYVTKWLEIDGGATNKVYIEVFKTRIEKYFECAGNEGTMLRYRKVNKTLRKYGVTKPGGANVKIRGKQEKATNFTELLEDKRWQSFSLIFGDM